jgi:hypothetical protein
VYGCVYFAHSWFAALKVDGDTIHCLGIWASSTYHIKLMTLYIFLSCILAEPGSASSSVHLGQRRVMMSIPNIQ